RSFAVPTLYLTAISKLLYYTVSDLPRYSPILVKYANRGRRPRPAIASLDFLFFFFGLYNLPCPTGILSALLRRKIKMKLWLRLTVTAVMAVSLSGGFGLIYRAAAQARGAATATAPETVKKAGEGFKNVT